MGSVVGVKNRSPNTYPESRGSGGGGPGTIIVEDHGADPTAVDTIDFEGAGVTVAFGPPGKATVTIPGGGGGAATAVVVPATTTGLVSGQFVYISGDNTASPAQANGFPQAQVVGAYQGVSGEIQVGGAIMNAMFDGAGAPVAGNPCWLSPTDAGKLTAVAPGAGNVLSPVGTILAAAGVAVIIEIGPPTQL